MLMEVSRLAAWQKRPQSGYFLHANGCYWCWIAPMGFQAIGNKHLPDDRFYEPAYLRSPDTGLGSQIGSKLDAALAKLYTWCSANNAPIMAHTSHSFGPNSDYEDRADPTFWANVLKPDTDRKSVV